MSLAARTDPDIATPATGPCSRVGRADDCADRERDEVEVVWLGGDDAGPFECMELPTDGDQLEDVIVGLIG